MVLDQTDFLLKSIVSLSLVLENDSALQFTVIDHIGSRNPLPVIFYAFPQVLGTLMRLKI